MDGEFLKNLILGLLCLDVVIIMLLILMKKLGKRRFILRQNIHKRIISGFTQENFEEIAEVFKQAPKKLLEALGNTANIIQLSSGFKENIIRLYTSKGWIKKLIKGLNSAFSIIRTRRILLLLNFDTPEVRDILKKVLKTEKKYSVKILIVHGLCQMKDVSALDAICQTLEGAPDWYCLKVYQQLELFGEMIKEWGEAHVKNREYHIVKVVLKIASFVPSAELKTFLQRGLTYYSGEMLFMVLDSVLKMYPKMLLINDLFYHENPDVRFFAFKSYLKSRRRLDLTYLIHFFQSPGFIIKGLPVFSDFLALYPENTFTVLEAFEKEEDRTVRENLALALETKLAYLLSNSLAEHWSGVKKLIFTFIEKGKNAVIIDFLNKNKRPDIEKKILGAIRPITKVNAEFRSVCALYLEKSLLDKLKIGKQVETESSHKIPISKGDKMLQFGLLIIIILIYPVVSIIHYREWFGIFPIEEILKRCLLDYNFIFAYYSIAINSIYLILLIFSGINLFRQWYYWQRHNYNYLFSPGIMPGVSIVAPAYGEEKTIIQSVYSLLSLRYPDYELIVVNDGSKDNTIGVLIDHFNLERIDLSNTGQLKTAPIRGVYKNRSIPNLLVIDKENGGKADALNTGINYSTKDYVCSIDSDSLLEPEALVKIMYQVVNKDTEVVAVGGNILPINGCELKMGALKTIGLSKNPLAVFQTIEYIRAFIAGRMGWAFLNSLLIISGAFGVFKRKRVLEIGGYLTGRGIFKKDTVGEDMELVVRLIKYMRENGFPYAVDYAFNANCWTEVPEDFSSMYKQRDRWHRGLIDILTYHKKMLFNPKYGKTGLVSFPYFLIFELIGPFFEFFGYIFLILSGVLGVLSFETFLFMFVSIIMYGILISLASLLFSENDVVYFRFKELLMITLAAFIENFGYRQVVSMARVFAYVEGLFKSKGWQKLERKGFEDTVNKS